MVDATRLGAELDRLTSGDLLTADLEQLQREASGLGTRAAGAIELVKAGLDALEHAAVGAVSRAAAFQLVSAAVLGLDAGPLLACLLLRAGLLGEGCRLAKWSSLLMAEFAGFGNQLGEQPPSDAIEGVRAVYDAVVREPLLVSFMDRSRHYMELAQERGSSSAPQLVLAAAGCRAGSLAHGLCHLLQTLPGGPGAGWTAFKQLLDVEVLRQSFMSHLSAAAIVVRRRGGPTLPAGQLLALLHIAAAAARHAAASEQAVEDALGVVTFFLGADLALAPPTVQHGLQLAIQTVGSAAAALRRAAGAADGCGNGSSAEAGDSRSTSRGLGGVLRAYYSALEQLATTCLESPLDVHASTEQRAWDAAWQRAWDAAWQRAWDAAWLGQGIAEICAMAEAFVRLAVALAPALADGRMPAGGPGGAEDRRLAQDLARDSQALVAGVAFVGKRQQAGLEDWRALLWLSLTSAKAIHAWLALPRAQLCPLEETFGITFIPCKTSLVLAKMAVVRQMQAPDPVEQRWMPSSRHLSCLPMCLCSGLVVCHTQRQGMQLPATAALVVNNTDLPCLPASRDERLALAVTLAACQAASRVLEHGRSSDAPMSASSLVSLSELLSLLVLRCGSCHEFFPAAPRALETLMAVMQQLQVGRARQVD